MAKVGTSKKKRGKEIATYPKKLAQDAAYQSYTSLLIELWSLPKLVLGLNTYNNNNLSENPKGENHLEDLGEAGGYLYMYRSETGCVGVIWTHADKWRSLVNTVMNCLHLCGEPTHMHMFQHILLISYVFLSRLRLSSGAAQDYW